MITRHAGELFGDATVHFSCECGWSSQTYRGHLDDNGGMSGLVGLAVRCHLADVHGDQLDVGRCEKCGQPTEHFRAVTPMGTLYLCETHSPAMSDLDVTVRAP